jgi:phosphoribosylanthranilate isomerase
MKVKICGITDKKTAMETCKLGADAIGFVFAHSKRKVSVEVARDISKSLPSNVKKVGVFVNETKERIFEIAEEVKLDYIQLHGDESPNFCEGINIPIIKAFSIKNEEDLQNAQKYNVSLFLLDSAREEYYGGNGKAFNWKLIGTNFSEIEPTILAGGLTHNNVKQAINIVKPAWVDVSSGVETNGVKDLNKIEKFIQNAKN